MARLISCSVCMRVHSKDHICNAKKKRRLEKNKGRVDSDIYGGNKWRVTRWQVLEDCNHICLYTLYKEGKIVKATDVHHIVEILEDEALAYEKENLIGLSKEKHKLIHELYKDNKKLVQEELKEMKRMWEDRIGIPPGVNRV